MSKINEKLSKVLGTPVRSGQLRQNLEMLDRTGAISKKIQLEMIIAICEVLDENETNIQSSKK